MTSGSQDPDPAADGDGAGCDEAQRLLQVFASDRLSREEDRHFRSHLVACPGCRSDYRVAIRATAKLGRALRARRPVTAAAVLAGRAPREREEREEPGQRTARAKQAIARVSAAGSGRRFGLRLALISALLVFALSRLGAPGGDAAFRATWQGGDVRAAGVSLGSERPTADLTAGDWCVTLQAGRVLLESPAARARLEPNTQVMVEHVRLARLRLRSGTLEVHGDGTVGAALGLVSIRAGGARLRAAGGRLEIHALAGEVVFTNAGSERVLGPGEKVVLDADDLVATR